MTKKYEGQGLIDSDDLYRAFKDYDAALPESVTDYNELENKPLTLTENSIDDIDINATEFFDIDDDWLVEAEYDHYQSSSQEWLYNVTTQLSNAISDLDSFMTKIIQDADIPMEGAASSKGRFGSWGLVQQVSESITREIAIPTHEDSRGIGIVKLNCFLTYKEVDPTDIYQVKADNPSTFNASESHWVKRMNSVLCKPGYESLFDAFSIILCNIYAPNTKHITFRSRRNVSDLAVYLYTNIQDPGYDNIFDIYKTVDGIDYILAEFKINLEFILTDSEDFFLTYEPVSDIPYNLWGQLDHPEFADVATSGSYNDLSDKPTIPPSKEKGYGTYSDEFDKLFWADCLDDDNTEGNMVQLDEFISGTLSPNGYSSIGGFAASLGGDLDPRINLVGDGSIEISTNVGDPIPEVWVYTDGDVSGRWIKVQDAAKGIMMADQSAYDMVNDIHYPQDDSNPAFAFGFNSTASSATYVTTIKLNSLWGNDIRFKVIVGVNKYTGQGKTTIS